MQTTDAEPADDIHPDTIAGYRIIRLLGEGGMGRVYLAREQHPPREVALKLIRSLQPQAQQRFRREAELLAALEHPGIARLYAAGETDLGGLRLPWLAIEHVDGHDLVTHADAHGLDLPARVRLLIAVCRAVQHAHGRGVIHRDLKPGNILVDRDGAPRVLDFGIARLHDDQDGMTAAGQVLGTLPYMAPELIEHGGRGDVAGDVYALGVIAYELIARQLPYPKLSTSTLFEALDIVRRETPRPLAELAPAARGDLECVVMKALDADPQRRYASVAEFAGDLGRVLDHRPVEARPPSAAYLLTRFMRRHRLVATTIGIAAVLLITATAVSIRMAVAEAMARETADVRAAEALAISGFLERMLTSVDPADGEGREVRVIELLDQAAAELQQDTLPEESRKRLQYTLGRVYVSMGQPEQGLDLFDRIEATGPDDRPFAVDLSLSRAAALTDAGHFDAAARALDALEGGMLTLSADEVVRLQLARAVIEAERGQLGDAIARLETALEDARTRLGSDSPQAVDARHLLAVVLHRALKFDAAAEHAAAVLAAREQALGPEHVETLDSTNLLASIIMQQGDTANAEPLMRRTLAGRRKALGESHPQTLNAQRNLAILLMQDKRFDESEALMRPLLDRWRSLRGDAAQPTLMAKQSLAYLYEDQGRIDEAERLLREIVSALEAAGGPGDFMMTSPRNNLAMLLMSRGDLAAARIEFEGLLRWTEPMLEADNPILAIYRGNYGDCLARLQRHADARQVLEQSHAVLLAALGAGHDRTRKVAKRLREVYTALGLRAAADALGHDEA